MNHLGLDPKAGRSKRDSRAIDDAFLKHDLLRKKVVWHNDYWLDYFLHLRLEHPFLALLYGHRSHSYNVRERRCAFIGIQGIVIGLAALLTAVLSIIDGLDDVSEFIINFVFDLIFGFFISYVQKLYEFSATCECVEHKGKKVRGCFKTMGHCLMCSLIIGGIGFGIGFVAASLSIINQNNKEDVDTGSVIFVFFINYVSGLALAWFFIDLLAISIYFRGEWYAQKGKEPPCSCGCYGKNCDCSFCDPCKKFCYCNYCCYMAWCCGWCCFYYRWFGAYFVAQAKKAYPTDKQGNVIGSRNGEFAITWQDYVNYSRKQPLTQRNFKGILNKMSVNTKNAKLDPKELELQVQVQVPSAENSTNNQ